MTENEEVQLIVDIEKGMVSGEHITFEQMANELPGHISGDLHFTIKEERSPDVMFRRGRMENGEKVQDLYMNMRLRLVDSLTGFLTTVPHLDNHDIVIDRRGKVTPCGHVMVIPGEGMPVKGREGVFGDMVVTFEIKFPETLSPDVQSKLKTLLA
jgi:DnaJ-class molecular chaperone